MKKFFVFALLLVIGVTSVPSDLRAAGASRSTSVFAMTSDEDSDDDSDSDSDSDRKKHKKKFKRAKDGRDRAQSRTGDICVDSNRDGLCDVIDRRRGRLPSPRDRRGIGDSMGGILGSVIRGGLYRAQLGR